MMCSHMRKSKRFRNTFLENAARVVVSRALEHKAGVYGGSGPWLLPRLGWIGAQVPVPL